MIDGLFANDTTLELMQTLDGVDTVVGYVFASASSEPGVSQEQRWVLYDKYRTPPGTPLVLRSPPAALSFTSLSGWQGAVRAGEKGGLFRPGSTYVKVFSESHDRIKDPVQNPPRVPPLSSGSSTQGSALGTASRESDKIKIKKGQADSFGIQVVDRSIVFQGGSTHVGHVLGTQRESTTFEIATNTEYWIALKSYAPPSGTAGAQGTTLRGLEPSWTGDAASFLREMQASWQESSTFIIATCAYLKALPIDP